MRVATIENVCSHSYFLRPDYIYGNIYGSLLLGLVSFNVLQLMYHAGVDLKEKRKWRTVRFQGCTYVSRGVESLLAGIFVCPLLTDAVALRATWTSEGEEVPDPNYLLLGECNESGRIRSD